MCTLVAVWMWVPRHQDLTMMGTNGCLSVALLRSQTALFVLTNHKSPLSPGPQPPPQADQAVVRRISLFHFSLLLFLAFLFFFSPPPFFSSCCQVGFGACKWHNHVHDSLSVLCIYSPFKKKKTIVFQYNFFLFLFFKEKSEYDATHVAVSWCLAYASLS